MKRHIFLTGEVQVGKSTAIGKALALLGNPPVGGFRTVSVPLPEIPKSHFGVFILPGCLPYGVPLDQEHLTDWPLDRDHLLAIRWGQGDHTPFPDAFNAGGLPLLEQQPPGCRLLLMDEIGVFEGAQPSFCAAIRRCLEAPLPVVGVLKKKPAPFLQEVSQRPDVTVLEVTRENRDQIPERILSLLNTD